MTATRHLGLDLGGTNLKWTVVEHDAASWRVVDRGHVVTRTHDGPAVIVGQLGDTAAAAIQTWPDLVTAGIGIPGLYDPRAGTTRLLVNIPGPWDGVPVAAPIAAALGV